VRLYFFTRFTLLMFVVFSTIFTLKGRGESRVKGFFIKKNFLLTFLIICMFYVTFFSLSKEEMGSRFLFIYFSLFVNFYYL